MKHLIRFLTLPSTICDWMVVGFRVLKKVLSGETPSTKLVIITDIKYSEEVMNKEIINLLKK